MKNILPFTTNPLPSLDPAGGKALSLMQMTRSGLPVPPGFVLTVGFFEPWLARLKQTPVWVMLNQSCNAEIGQAARTLQELCRDLQWS